MPAQVAVSVGAFASLDDTSSLLPSNLTSAHPRRPPEVAPSIQPASRTAEKGSSPLSLLLACFALSVVVCLISAAAAQLGLLRSAELRGFDLLVSTRGCAPSPEIVVVDFDDASVEAFHAFPIPRELLANIVAKISSGGPELIGLDILLDMPREEAADTELLHTIQTADNVILAEVFETEALPAAKPLPHFRDAALDVAFVNMPLDPDGFVRRMLLWMRGADYQGVSFPIALASNYWQEPLQADPAGGYRLGATQISTDESAPNSALITAWCLPTTVTVLRLLEEDFDTELFAGKIVIVGQSSTAAKDLYPTPLFRQGGGQGGRALTSGTEVHAAALATILGSQTVRAMAGPLLWGMNLILAWLAALAVIRARPVFGVLALLAICAGAVLLAHVLFSQQAIWMGFASTEVALALTLPAGLGFRYLRERRLKAFAEMERGEIMQLFERYVSPEVAAEIWNRRDEIVLESQERTATVLFSDIRGFTSLTEGKSSEEVLAWLNRYFEAMSDVVKRNGGMLNKFMGDGMLVVFGVPLSQGVEEDARRAVRAAVEMLERVEAMNREREPGRPHCAIGIGLHTGTLTAGNVGGRDRLEYSVVGETVNLASRLEALTKEFQVGVVMSPHTRDLLGDHFETLPLGEVTVRGFTDAVHIHTLGNRLSPEVEP